MNGTRQSEPETVAVELPGAGFDVSRAGSRSWWLLPAMMAVGVGGLALDLSLPFGAAGAVSHVALVMFGLWLPQPRHVFLLAVIASVLTLVGYFGFPTGGVASVAFANRGLALLGIWVAALFIASYKQFEWRLKARDATLSKILATTPDIVTITRASDGLISYVNRAFSEATGYTPQEALGKTAVELNLWVDPEDRDALIREIQRRREISNFEIEYRIKGGAILLMSMSYSVIDIDDVQCVLSMGRDVTEVRAATKALKRNEALLATTARMAKLGGWEADVESRTASFTKQIYRILGLAPETKLGLDEALDYFDAADRPKVTAALQRMTDSGEPFDLEARLTTATGKQLWTRAIGKAYRVEGKTVTVNGILQDISEIKYVQEVLKRSEDALGFALEATETGLLDWNIAADHLVGTWHVPLGYDAGAVGNDVEQWVALMHPDDVAPAKAILLDHLRGSTAVCDTEYRFKVADGTFRWYHFRGRVFERDAAGRATRLTGLHTDIDERKQAELDLQKLSRAVEASSSIVIITDFDGSIEYVNPKFSEVTGYAKEEAIGRNPALLQSGETPAPVYAELWQTITSGGEWKGEFHNRKKNGGYYWCRASISAVKDTGGKTTHFVAIQEDVTHEYELSAKLSYQASHDALTGLINRHEFERRAERLLSTVGQKDDEHALCFIDLDQFKVVNDTCGHMAGDELLRQLGAVVQDAVRQRDTLARIGGDEFGVLMEHCSLEHAHRAAVSLQEAVQDYQFTWEGHVFKVGASIGLVAVTKDISNLSELLKQADAACYMAKDLGRNRIHVYHPEDAELAQRHGEMQWVARIHRAVEDDRLRLYAQPIVPLDNSSDTHYELLIRMIDEDGQVVPPGAFLPAAERYNLVESLDRWVIESAFSLLAENPVFLAETTFVSINLSGQSLTRGDFLDFVISQFGTFKIDGAKICFEITETAAISNLSAAAKFISNLKGQGCRFALDDFGSGLSSFAYLKNLSVDYLKIDGMFVRDILGDPIDHAMVKSINEIGHVMGMQTIAEFVENDEIKGMLRENGVNYAQGYGISRPLPFEDLLAGTLEADDQTVVDTGEHLANAGEIT